jgi:uncharacterized small protein (DUF1192 family)
MNYENEASGQMLVGGYSRDLSMGGSDTTVSQNIDNRIAQLREQIARLEAVKEKLSGGSILDMSLPDLALAMARY